MGQTEIIQYLKKISPRRVLVGDLRKAKLGSQCTIQHSLKKLRDFNKGKMIKFDKVEVHFNKSRRGARKAEVFRYWV